MYFPTTCVDDFFDRPDRVIKLAQSLEYADCSVRTGSWPGTRTETLQVVAREFYMLFCNKLLSIFFDSKTDILRGWEIQAMFQRFPAQQYGNISSGWIHTDGCILSGLVYLTPNINPSCGTRLYKPLDYTVGIDAELSKLIDEQYKNFDPDREQVYEQAKKQHNSKFVETIKFNNVYNRLICYSGDMFHGVENFFDDDQNERLTLVFFVKNVVASNFPMPNMRSVQL